VPSEAQAQQAATQEKPPCRQWIAHRLVAYAFLVAKQASTFFAKVVDLILFWR
jgi:hypothetical protein